MKTNNFFGLFKRKIFTILSFSTTLFIFQACYGTPQDFEEDIKLSGLVLSAETNEPIQGINVHLKNSDQYIQTDEKGAFEFYTYTDSEYHFSFIDADSTLNGSYNSLDTILPGDTSSSILIKLQKQ